MKQPIKTLGKPMRIIEHQCKTDASKHLEIDARNCFQICDGWSNNQLGAALRR